MKKEKTRIQNAHADPAHRQGKFSPPLDAAKHDKAYAAHFPGQDVELERLKQKIGLNVWMGRLLMALIPAAVALGMVLGR